MSEHNLINAVHKVVRKIKIGECRQIHSQERRLQGWAEHFGAQFSWHTTKLGLSLISASEPMQVDAGYGGDQGDTFS